MSSCCDELRTKLTDLQTELDEIKKKLEETSQKALEEIPLDIHTEVAALDESKKWKKRALEKYSFVDNICDLLDELYYYLYEDKDNKNDIPPYLILSTPPAPKGLEVYLIY